MSKRNIKNSILINFLRFILFLLYFFSQFIFCEECSGEIYTTPTVITDSVNNNEDDCRFSVTKNKWYKCYTTAEYGSDKSYYVIGAEDKCVFSYSCKRFAANSMGVLQTHECLESCAKIDDSLKAKFIQYGDYCIYSENGNNLFGQGENSLHRDYELIPNNGYQILKCNKSEYSELKDGLTYTQCLVGENCPTDYYDYEIHQCLTGCHSNKKKIERRNSLNELKYQCVSECNVDNFYFKQDMRVVQKDLNIIIMELKDL